MFNYFIFICEELEMICMAFTITKSSMSDQ